MLAPSAPASAPWEVGPEPIYQPTRESQALWGWSFDSSNSSLQGPQGNEREMKLRDWGRRREDNLRRPPRWCMDQLISGSGLYPPRLLDESWFSQEELSQVAQLEQLLAP